MLQADPLLAGGYNGVGISQGENPNKDDFYQINDDFYCPLCSTRFTPGGLLMRGLAQKCPEPPMVNLITYGAPSNGIFGIPNCEETTESYELCDLVREIISAGAYQPWLQVTEPTCPSYRYNEAYMPWLQVTEPT